MEIKTAIERCLDDLSLAKRTRTAYNTGLKSFIAYLHTQGIEVTDEVEKLTVDSFIYFLPYLNRRVSKGTAGVYGSASKALLDWMVIANMLQPTYNDTIRIKKSMNRSHRRHEDKLPRFPNRTDVPKMLEAVRLYEETPRKERNIALLELLASTGCRNNEIVQLKVKDIDLVNRTTIVIGKGSKERRVWFSHAAADALKEYWRVRGSSKAPEPALARHDKGAGHKIKPMTTTTTRNIVKDVAVLAGIDPAKFSPHYFRHAFAIRVLSETGNLALVQDLMGHESPSSTRVYAKIYSEDMQKAHREIFK
jgi:site-specific recombinase XerD